MMNTYINRTEKTKESQNKWTCISNKIIDNLNLKLNDKSVMAICLMNQTGFNIRIESLQEKTGLRKDKLRYSKERLIDNGYMKHIQTKIKFWELYIDETGTNTFTKYIHKDNYQNSGYTQVSNVLLNQVEEGVIGVEELGILLHLLRNKDDFQETEKTLKKKLNLHPSTFNKYFNRLIEKGYVKLYKEIIYTDETGSFNFPAMTRVQKQRKLMTDIASPIKFKSVEEKVLVNEYAQLPREEWIDWSDDLLYKVQVQHLKNNCKMLVA